MIDKLIIEPMSEEFIVWRCLHTGLLSRGNIDRFFSSTDDIPFDRYRKRNIRLLEKLTRTYGACTIMAREGGKIVGLLRFYPKAICQLEEAGGLCLQQDYAEGPRDDFADSDFPPLSSIQDRTLAVHCMMIGSPRQQENPYRRRGIGTGMVKTLIRWAEENGWERIEVYSFEDLPIIYEITGSAGQTFWKKLGFRIVYRRPHPDLQDKSQYSEFIEILEEQAESIGIPPDRAKHRLLMRLDLK